MLFAHISDLHFRSEGRKLYDFIDTNTANADVMNRINSLDEKPDAVIITGDIVNCGLPSEYNVAKRILGFLNYPIYVIPGNHDDKVHFLDHMGPLCPQLGNDPENIAYKVNTDHAQLLFIDSSQSGESAGWISESILAWLKNQLKHNTKPSYLFMHHPPIAFGNRQMDRIACKNGHELLALIDEFPHFLRIFCGHVHRTIFTQYKQAIIASAPGTVHQVPYHFTDPTDVYSIEPPAMLMHRLVDNVGLVTYSQPLSQISGPYRYFSSIGCPGD
ncbi:phosphodiesterase [Orbus sasakiae]|uniref:Phosphodiesterase n=1 Tax=Orbus sasakiae TaxID=1078475 RepID=A0ABP9N6B0_9GAMM